LVPVNNVQKLGIAIREALEAPERITAQGIAGQMRAQEYSVDRAVEHYWNIIDQIR
jgi:glycosyltransferase involved in cell wall biosynthesis